MATNDFLPFGTGAGANVLAQAAYAALAARSTGFQAGVAKSAEVNKALRQGSFMAAVLAQFIADHSGQDMRDDGDQGGAKDKLDRALRARFGNVQGFTTSGNFTVPASVTKLRVRLVGGGASGGWGSSAQAGEGGSAGGYVEKICAVTPGQVIAVTVGVGGPSPAAASQPGRAGGTSSFGAFCSATGGGGSSVLGSGGASGNGAGGDINILGGNGGDGTSGSTSMGGSGGASAFGGGGRAGTTGGGTGAAPGSGGGGSYGGAAGMPAKGADGIVIIEW